MTPSQRLDQIEPVLAELIVKQDLMEKKLDSLTELVEQQSDNISFLLKNQLAISRKIEKIEGRLAHIENKVEKIEGRLDKIENRLDAIEIRLDKMDQRFDAIEIRLDKMDQRFDAIEIRLDKMDERFDKFALTQDAILAILSRNN